MIALLRIKTSGGVSELTGPVFTAVLPADLGAPRLLGPFFASSSIKGQDSSHSSREDLERKT